MYACTCLFLCYSIDVVFRRCAGAGSAAAVAAGVYNLSTVGNSSMRGQPSPSPSPPACRLDVSTISPSAPGTCKTFSAVGDAPMANGTGYVRCDMLMADFAKRSVFRGLLLTHAHIYVYTIQIRSVLALHTLCTDLN